MQGNLNQTYATNNTSLWGLPPALPPLNVIEAPAIIRPTEPIAGDLANIDYNAIIRKALTISSSSGISDCDLYLSIFNANPAISCTTISTLHQHGPSDSLHFGFLLVINPTKKIRFRVNGWWSNGFHIQNIQIWRPVGYLTIASVL